MLGRIIAYALMLFYLNVKSINIFSSESILSLWIFEKEKKISIWKFNVYSNTNLTTKYFKWFIYSEKIYKSYCNKHLNVYKLKWMHRENEINKLYTFKLNKNWSKITNKKQKPHWNPMYTHKHTLTLNQLQKSISNREILTIYQRW